MTYGAKLRQLQHFRVQLPATVDVTALDEAFECMPELRTLELGGSECLGRFHREFASMLTCLRDFSVRMASRRLLGNSCLKACALHNLVSARWPSLPGAGNVRRAQQET